MNTVQIMVLVENQAVLPLHPEHGLSLLIEHDKHRILFDTGAGGALLHNAQILDVDLETVEHVVLSHGHNDHTGGLHLFHGKKIWHTPEITCPHFSRHTDRPVSNITMPEEAQNVLKAATQCIVGRFQEMLPGIYLTGPIPRISGETTGGPFYHDPEGNTPDHIPDEQAMLFENGVLIQGCCHAGIINTLEYCRKSVPEIPIHTIIGGLHLLHADDTRLQRTAEYLHQSGVTTLYLMHCTGVDAVNYMRSAGFRVITPCAGELITISAEK